MKGEQNKYANVSSKVRSTYTGHDGDEELRSIGVGPSVGHGQGIGAVMAKVLVKFILKLSTPY